MSGGVRREQMKSDQLAASSQGFMMRDWEMHGSIQLALCARLLFGWKCHTRVEAIAIIKVGDHRS